MPVALAPSSVFPLSASQPLTTEAKASFVSYSGAYQAPEPLAYRGPMPVEPDQVISQPPSIVAQLSSLSARIEALSTGAAPPPRPPAAAVARVAQLEGSRLPTDSSMKPWEGTHYDTFGKKTRRPLDQGSALQCYQSLLTTLCFFFSLCVSSQIRGRGFARSQHRTPAVRQRQQEDGRLGVLYPSSAIIRERENACVYLWASRDV